MKDRYIEVQTALHLGAVPVNWLKTHGFGIGSLNDIRDLFPETQGGAMRDWMNGHPELPNSDIMASSLWITMPATVIRCERHEDHEPVRQIWWFPPDQRELAMMFKLVFSG